MSTCSWLRTVPSFAGSIGPRTVSTVVIRYLPCSPTSRDRDPLSMMPMGVGRFRAVAALAAVVVLVAGCLNPAPTPSPTTIAVGPTPSPAATPTAPAPSPTSTVKPLPASFPLAVVTGLTNLKSATTVAELTRLAAKGKLVMPCGIEVTAPALAASTTCTDAGKIAVAIGADQSLVALLPPGLVEPATKILPIGGTGPSGLVR